MKVKCLAQQHNTMSPTRARTRSTRHESSALTMRPPCLPKKYVNTAEIISKVAMSLSLINSNKYFDFVGWVIKTPCLFIFTVLSLTRSLLPISFWSHYVKERPMPFCVGENCSSISAHTRDNETNLCHNWFTMENTDAVIHYVNELLVLVRPFKNFCELAK